MSKNNPLVSVVISCYNCEKYVELAVQSIIKQTYKNIEILITDDCSTDTTCSILEKLAQKDSRIIFLKNAENLKLARTLNNMIACAKGKYIARMDADDTSLPERIEKQVTWMEANPDYVICGTNAWCITANGKKIRASHLPHTNEEINKAKYYVNPFFHPSIMILKDIIMINKYNEDYFIAQDYELWFRILKNYLGYNLKERLLLYRILPSSVTSMGKNDGPKLLVKLFAENLTGKNIELSKKYINGFLHRTERVKCNALNTQLLCLLNSVNDCKGFNFYILFIFFRFYYKENILTFMCHLSIKENVKFFIKMIAHIFETVVSLIRKKIYT